MSGIGEWAMWNMTLYTNDLSKNLNDTIAPFVNVTMPINSTTSNVTWSFVAWSNPNILSNQTSDITNLMQGMSSVVAIGIICVIIMAVWMMWSSGEPKKKHKRRNNFDEADDDEEIVL